MRQANTQTESIQTSRRAMKRDPNRTYFLCENKDKGEWETPMEEILDQMSATNPGEEKYRVESTDRKDTGSSRMALLSCLNEDYDVTLKSHEQGADERARYQRFELGQGEFESIKGHLQGTGGPLTAE